MKFTSFEFNGSASSTRTILVLTSDFQYLLVKEFVMLTTSDHFGVYGFKPGTIATPTSLVSSEWFNLNLTSQKRVPEELDSAAVAVIFIMPTDLSEVVSLTRSFIDIAQQKGIRRLAWVAPACLNGEVSDRLKEAESLVCGLNIETLILRHAPLFSQMLMLKRKLRFRRTLSLPLGNTTLPWLEPEAIAQGLSKWLHGKIKNPPPEIFTGSHQLSGSVIF